MKLGYEIAVAKLIFMECNLTDVRLNMEEVLLSEFLSKSSVFWC
jgi:hypothetical protein